MITLKETPLEKHCIAMDAYTIEETKYHAIWVKREDLCWPYPPISKARGVWAAIESRPDAKTLAVVDTGKSVNGLLVTTIGLTFKRKIIVGYPRYVDNPDAIPGPVLAIQSLAHGDVELIPIPANRQFVMRARMKAILEDRHKKGSSILREYFLFPTGLRLPETVTAVEGQMRDVAQTLGHVGTVVVPTGTGTHLAGVLRGFPGDVVAVQGYSRPEARFRIDVERMAGANIYQKRLRVVTSLCDYYEARPEHLPPWPANPYYECKAYTWLRIPGVIESLAQPIVFWNIGA